MDHGFALLFGGTEFLPRGHGMYWVGSLIATLVVADTVLFLGAALIAAMLLRLAWRHAGKPLGRELGLHALTVLVCASPCLTDMATIWTSWYWIDAGLRVLAAAFCLLSAGLLALRLRRGEAE
jgi:hypothetical protein